MGKLDELRRQTSGAVRESMGATRHRADPAPTGPILGGPQFEGVARNKHAADIAIERIVRDPRQPRREFDAESLARLAESLKSRGQLQPIRVRWDFDQSRYVLIAGERRWRAAGLAGLATILAVIQDGDLSPEEILTDQLTENCLRDDLSPIDQAQAYRRLMDHHGWSTTELAQHLHVSQAAVVKAVKLLTLPAEIQDRVKDGVLPASAAYEVAQIEDPEEQVAVAGQVVRGELGRAALRARKAKKVRRSEEFPVRDFLITIQGPVDNLAAMHAAIVELGQQLAERLTA